MGMMTVLGSMVFMPLDGIVSVFKGLTTRLRTVSSGRRGVMFGIVVRIFAFLLWPYYKGA
jgi:hypothetical protein